MRIFQEEIFGPVVSVATFKDYDDAMHIADDTSTASAPESGRATATPGTAPAAR